MIFLGRIAYALIGAASLVSLLQPDSAAERWTSPYSRSMPTRRESIPDTTTSTNPIRSNIPSDPSDSRPYTNDLTETFRREKLSLDADVRVYTVDRKPVDMRFSLVYSVRSKEFDTTIGIMDNEYGDYLIVNMIKAAASMAFDGRPEMSYYMDASDIKKHEEGKRYVCTAMRSELNRLMNFVGFNVEKIYLPKMEYCCSNVETSFDSYPGREIPASSLFLCQKTRVTALATDGRNVDLDFILFYDNPAQNGANPDAQHSTQYGDEFFRDALQDAAADVLLKYDSIANYINDETPCREGREFVSKKVMVPLYKAMDEKGLELRGLVLTNMVHSNSPCPVPKEAPLLIVDPEIASGYTKKQ